MEAMQYQEAAQDDQMQQEEAGGPLSVNVLQVAVLLFSGADG
jgi:hypothetical protein